MLALVMRSFPVLIAFALLAACGNSNESVSNTSAGSEGTGEPVAEPTPSSEAPDDGAASLVVSGDACTTSADCVPAACCHAAACVGAANGPSCEDAMCTEECRYGTLDCGGSCICYVGHCAARLSVPPAGITNLPPPS